MAHATPRRPQCASADSIHTCSSAASATRSVRRTDQLPKARAQRNTLKIRAKAPQRVEAVAQTAGGEEGRDARGDLGANLERVQLRGVGGEPRAHATAATAAIAAIAARRTAAAAALVAAVAAIAAVCHPLEPAALVRAPQLLGEGGELGFGRLAAMQLHKLLPRHLRPLQKALMCRPQLLCERGELVIGRLAAVELQEAFPSDLRPPLAAAVAATSTSTPTSASASTAAATCAAVLVRLLRGVGIQPPPREEHTLPAGPSKPSHVETAQRALGDAHEGEDRAGAERDHIDVDGKRRAGQLLLGQPHVDVVLSAALRRVAHARRPVLVVDDRDADPSRPHDAHLPRRAATMEGARVRRIRHQHEEGRPVRRRVDEPKAACRAQSGAAAAAEAEVRVRM